MVASKHRDRALPKHEFVAGKISLDFCNTLSRTPQDFDWDRASNPRDFFRWAERCGIGLKRTPTAAELARLLVLRASLAAIFDSVVDGRKPADDDLAVLNAGLADARSAERLVARTTGFTLEDGTAGTIDGFLHGIVCEAVGLLTDDIRRIKRCPDRECLWLFHDGSKNLSRRWCTMEDCGTKDKVRRFREREERR